MNVEEKELKLFFSWKITQEGLCVIKCFCFVLKLRYSGFKRLFEKCLTYMWHVGYKGLRRVGIKSCNLFTQ